MSADDNRQQYKLMNRSVEVVYKVIGERLQDARRKQGLSQETLAAMADVDRSHVGFIEQGRRMPTIATLFKLCKALKLNFEDLFAGL